MKLEASIQLGPLSIGEHGRHLGVRDRGPDSLDELDSFRHGHPPELIHRKLHGEILA